MIVSTISEKVDKSDADSLESVTIKDEPGLTMSRAYSVTSEPPAYQKRTSNSVRIARLIALTVVVVALILGAAIIAAAYLQSRHAQPLTPNTSTETNFVAIDSKAATESSSHSALTGEAPDDKESSSESSAEVSDDDEKGHRRLDTEPDLLEEFLENEGKILRLPTSHADAGDFDIDIDELTKMFMSRNPIDKSKCFVERRPIGGLDSEGLVKTLPITAKNASAVPVFPIISGERVSIICSSDDEDDEDDSMIPSRPSMMPFGMRPPPLRFGQPLMGSLNDSPIRTMMLGPFPMMMNPNNINGPMMMNPSNTNGPMMMNLNSINGPMMMNPNGINGPMMPSPMRSMRPPPPPFGLSPPGPFNVMNGNDLLEQRSSFNAPLPSPFARSPMFQQQAPERPIRFPEPSAPQQFQPFQQRAPMPSMNIPMMNQDNGEKRFLPPQMPENSQEKAHVPEHRMNSPPITMPAQPSPRPVFRMPERQSNPIVPDFPENLLRLLADLPDIVQSEPQQPPQRLAVNPALPNSPVFRVPRPMGVSPVPPPTPSSTPAPVSRLAQSPPARPVTLPFLQVPNAPAAPKERSGPIPVNIPFLNIRPLMQQQPSGSADPAMRRQGPTSFFERLIDSLLSAGDNNNNDKVGKTPVDSMPMETRSPPPIRTGGRGLRMPLDGPNNSNLPAGVIVARPIDRASEADDQQPIIVPAVGEDRVARSHFIQPR